MTSFIGRDFGPKVSSWWSLREYGAMQRWPGIIFQYTSYILDIKTSGWAKIASLLPLTIYGHPIPELSDIHRSLSCPRLVFGRPDAWVFKNNKFHSFCGDGHVMPVAMSRSWSCYRAFSHIPRFGILGWYPMIFFKDESNNTMPRLFKDIF